MDTQKIAYRAGYIAVVGRPNVGKSTLLNHLIGEKISVTSRKPQTTQRPILGILTAEHAQLVFLDTPGVNSQIRKPFNRHLNKQALQVLPDVDVVLWVIEVNRWTDLERSLLPKLLACGKPIVVAVNKIDKLSDKNQLLPWLAELSRQLPDVSLIPVAALHNIQLDPLQEELIYHLPVSPQLFPDHQKTDQSDECRVAECIREKCVRQLGDELPYALQVEVERYQVGSRLINIDAVIRVSKVAHKKILLGRGGDRIKAVGMAAREDLERYFKQKVMLKLWVKLVRNQMFLEGEGGGA